MPEEVNVVKTDNPARYLVTWQEVGPGESKTHPVTEIIETEPSLWWRKKRRNACVIGDIAVLNTWYIGGGDG